MDPVALLAPSRCLACGARGAVPFCAPCGARLPILHRGCDRCAAPRGAAHACWPPDAPVDATIAVYDYRGPVSAGIAAAKLRGARASWPLLGAPLAQAVLAREPDLDVVTWVTTPRPRVRQRGVDHAQVLAREVARAGGWPLARLLDATAGDGADRYRAVCAIPGTQVLLVDDVLTTGATAWAAAGTLRAAGAGPITVAVLARAGNHALGAAQVGRHRPDPSGPASRVRSWWRAARGT